MVAKDLTEGKPLKVMLAFAVPLLIGSFFSQLYNVVDTMVAGYNLGDTAVGAISAPQSLLWIVIDLASGMNTGLSVVTGQYFGAKDMKKLRNGIASSIMINGALTAVVTPLSLVFLRFLLKNVMAVSDTFLELSYTYYFIIFAGMLFRVLYNMCEGIMRALGNSRTPLYFLIFSGFLNFGLDCLFVIVFKWGVAGAAWATIISEAVSGFLALGFLLLRFKEYLPTREDFKIRKDVLTELVSLGVSGASASIVLSIGGIIYSRGTNSLGDTYVVAYAAARKIISFCMQPLHALGKATSAYVSQNFGAGRKDRIRKGLFDVSLAGIIWSVAACLGVYAFGADMIRLLINTTDADVIHYAVLCMRLNLPFYPILAIQIIFRCALMSIGNKPVPVIANGIEMALKIVGGLFVIPLLGFIVVCIIEPISWILTAILLVTAFFCSKKMRRV